MTEATDKIERQVNRYKFDMSQSVKQSDARCVRSGLAPFRHVSWKQQCRLVRPGWCIGHVGIENVGETSKPPIARNLPCRHHLGMRVGCGEHRQACFTDG